MVLRQNKNQPKILFVSSSGGHFEQLLMLEPLMLKYPNAIVSEKTKINNKADYLMLQTNHKDKFVMIKMLVNIIYALIIWIKVRPAYIISTGSMIAIPFVILAKIAGSKVIFIETFSRINDKTKTGAFIYKWSDLFIVQWESLLELYPNAVYGGSIY